VTQSVSPPVSLLSNYDVLFLGRPFVKRFALCYRTVVCPVCNVRALWPNGWTDQDGTWHGGGPWSRPRCIRRGPSFRERGIAAPSLFDPCLLWPRSPISATAELLYYWVIGSRNISIGCAAWAMPASLSPT